MFWFIVWIFLSILVGIYANSKGRFGIGFFLVSIILSPLIGFLMALIAVPHEDNIMKNKNLKKCPFCKELVKEDAITCKYCHKDLNIKEITNRDILKKFENNTHIITIENFIDSDFNSIKNELIEQYKLEGFTDITRNDNTNLQIKRNDDKLGYIKLNIKDEIIKIEAYNVVSEPKLTLK
ncbi:zinc ribbon domain-containing protein [Arcobacter aquimarinus]|uniref:zinc ribbon domain-containing protein n=1 Tax=Arcobacter aquimarinus TaxID=1315211 RepID=UPI003BB1E795